MSKLLNKGLRLDLIGTIKKVYHLICNFFGLEGQGDCKMAANILKSFDCW